MKTVRMYHGSNRLFKTFEYHGNIGTGNDQEGVGFYLTTSEKEAMGYGKRIYVVDASFRKLISTTKPANSNEVMRMMKIAPELKHTLENWDENPTIALKKAWNAMMDSGDTAHQVYQSVWYDFYRNNPVHYLKNMVKTGYDGVMIPKSHKVTHLIAFDPQKLKIVGMA
jgi:hypothetical protein